MDENNEEYLALDVGFSTNIEEELSNLDLLSNLSLKDNTFKNFIKYLNNNDTKKYLVAKSQDKHVTENCYNNLLENEINLQIQLIILYSQLNNN